MRRNYSIHEWSRAHVAASLAELRAALERQDLERAIQAAARLEFTRARVLAGLDEVLRLGSEKRDGRPLEHYVKPPTHLSPEVWHTASPRRRAWQPQARL